jgi:hydrogenase expression/formation protein HypE
MTTLMDINAPTATDHELPPHVAEKQIVLAHGGGGQLTDQLLAEVVLPALQNDFLDRMDDAAVMPPGFNDRIVFTIDGYVVQPWRFPGGDIGKLAVCGTINDLAVQGARPIGIALGLILAEGFERHALDLVLASIGQTSRQAGVPVVTGDTKVVGRGQADGIYITTAGVGLRPCSNTLGIDRIRPGDQVMLTGPVGEHGLAVMLERELPEVKSALRSDVAPLHHMLKGLSDWLKDDLVFMRDPTRGGLAGVAADIAQQSGWHVVLNEASIPVRPEARHAADMLGLDPLEVANEGKAVLIVRAGRVGDALFYLHSEADPQLASQACVIGRVEDKPDGICELHTTLGGRRIVQKPYGEELPRIC